MTIKNLPGTAVLGPKTSKKGWIARGGWRVLAATLVAATATAGVAVPQASADTFTPANTPPTLSSPAFVMPNGMTAFQPNAGASTDTYEYDVTVGDAETLNDLSTVSVCLYQSKRLDNTTGDGDSTCESINPANTVKLSWDRPTNSFSLNAGSSTYWALGTSANASVAPTDLTLTTGTVKFRFTVSEAMRSGTWTANTTATDTSNATANDASAPAAVNAYSTITSRTAEDFGSSLAARAGGATKTDTPTVTSNGATSLSLTAGNFVSGAYSFTLDGTGATSVVPGPGEVTFDCNATASFTEATATRIGSGATLLAAETPTGTPEHGTAIDDTCRLEHGGQRPVGQYSFTVVNTIANG